MSISDRLVIMKAGRIVEVGTPLELYLSPKQIFTANFLGEANFISASVEECQAGRVIASVNGWKLEFPGSGFARGERLVLAVRPESILLSPTERDRDLEWTGVVKEHVLLGDIIRTEVELENGSRLISEMPNQDARGLKNIREQVRIAFVEERVLPYPFPAQGLDAELALE